MYLQYLHILSPEYNPIYCIIPIYSKSVLRCYICIRYCKKCRAPPEQRTNEHLCLPVQCLWYSYIQFTDMQVYKHVIRLQYTYIYTCPFRLNNGTLTKGAPVNTLKRLPPRVLAHAAVIIYNIIFRRFAKLFVFIIIIIYSRI